jgi:hypothetical protein
MKLTRYPTMKLGLLSLVLWWSLRAMPAFACAACAGKSDDLQAVGMNWGIYSLLAVVVLVLGGVATFFVCLARRAALAPEPLPQPLAESTPRV